MKTLFIDTSTQHGIVGIAEDGHVQLATLLPTDLNNSTAIMPAIDALFEKLQISPSSLDFITLGVGPGSYTGIRVAASIGKGIAYAKRIPVVPVTSLLLFVPQEEGEHTVLLDARIAGVYHLSATVEKGELTCMSEPKAVDFVSLSLAPHAHITTPHTATLQKKIPHTELKFMTPDSYHFVKKAFNTPLDSPVELLYLRKTQAELEKE